MDECAREATTPQPLARYLSDCFHDRVAKMLLSISPPPADVAFGCRHPDASTRMSTLHALIFCPSLQKSVCELLHGGIAEQVDPADVAQLYHAHIREQGWVPMSPDDMREIFGIVIGPERNPWHPQNCEADEGSAIYHFKVD